MVSNVNIDSAAVSLLTAYNSAQDQLTKVQSAVSSGYDVSKASDNPLFYLEASALRGQAGAYSAYIPKLTQDKSAADRLQSNIKTISDVASKIRDTLNSMSGTPTKAETANAATNIQSFVNTIANLINSSDDGNGFSLKYSHIVIDVAPNAAGSALKSSAVPQSQTMSFYSPSLTVSQFLQQKSKAGTPPSITANYISIAGTATGAIPTVYFADLTTATNRSVLLSAVSSFIDNTLSTAAASVGAFSNALDAQLQTMQTNQNGLNAEADALTKTDLTKDSAQSTALSTQQQLLTSLLSMSNQRMQTVLGLFR